MADLLTDRLASSIGVRQAVVRVRMLQAAGDVGTSAQVRVVKMVDRLRGAKGDHRSIRLIVLDELAQFVGDLEREAGAQIWSAAQWAYDSAAHAFLDGLPSEQLSWVALSKLGSDGPGVVPFMELEGIKYTMEQAIALKKALNLTQEEKDNLAKSGQALGVTGSASLILKLLNSAPPSLRPDGLSKWIQARIKSTKGILPPSVLDDVQALGGAKGAIKVGAPDSLADWWEQGFHKFPEAKKKEILKRYVFPSPSAEKVRQLVDKPMNVFGEQMTWQQRLQKTSKLVADPEQMSAKIANAISQGRGVDAVMKEILPQMQNVKVSAQRIARMEVARVSAEANDQVYDDAGEVVSGVQINATMDVAVRPEHAFRNGKIYTKGTQEWATRPSLPDDYNCRCYYSPVIRPPKQIQKNPDLLKQFESAAGPIMDPLVYSQWFGKASEAERRAVVGAKRYQAVLAKLGPGNSPTWADFVDEFGSLRSIKKIQKMDMGRFLAKRAQVQDVIDLRGEQLAEIRKKSFLAPSPQDLGNLLEPVGLDPIESPKPVAKAPIVQPTQPTVVPASDIGPGWTKVSTPGKGTKPKVEWVSPTGQKFATKKGAKESVSGGKPPEAKPLKVPGQPTPPAAAKGKPSKPGAFTAKTAPIIKPKPKGFPDDPRSLKVVRSLGGSTGAKLVEDEKGNKWVLKEGNSPEHVREEFATEEVYRSMGVAIPDSHLYDGPDGNPAKLSRWIEGKELGALSSKERDKAEAEIRKGFAADALLGNWDAVGANGDNVLVDGDGKVWRIDVGGSMRFRAQGKLKDAKDWNEYPTDLWSLKRSSSAHDQIRAKIFSDLTHDERVRQMREVLANRKEILKAANPENVETLKARLDQFADLVDVDETIKSDKWSEDYRDKFSEHTLGIRNSGISDQLPKSMRSNKRSHNYNLVDENGKPWDHLRGRDSIGHQVQKYIEGLPNGSVMWGTLTKYFKQQGGSSWSGVPAAIKVAMTKDRKADFKDYFWGDLKDPTGKVPRANYQASLKKIPENDLQTAIAAWHSFTYEMLRKTDIPYKAKDGKTLSLVRTHEKGALDKNFKGLDGKTIPDLKPGDRGKTKEGPLESCSLTNYVQVYGGKAIHYPKVPLHRVFGAYMVGPGSENDCLFLADRENELTVMLDGLECEFIGDIKRGEPRKEPKP
jgi:SPP1 gp7 family putative phage head morphogenesis protein